jgi:hypothetical protein
LSINDLRFNYLANRKQNQGTRMRRYLTAASFLAVLLIMACGGPNRSPSRLTGTVKYNGTLLRGGVMKLIHSEQGPFNGSIGRDGTYTINDLPTGDFIVCIDTETINPDKPATNQAMQKTGGAPANNNNRQGGNSGAAPKVRNEKMEKVNNQRKTAATGQDQPSPDQLRELYTKIPGKYSNEKQTDLTVSLVTGNNKKDFELKD